MPSSVRSTNSAPADVGIGASTARRLAALVLPETCPKKDGVNSIDNSNTQQFHDVGGLGDSARIWSAKAR